MSIKKCFQNCTLNTMKVFVALGLAFFFAACNEDDSSSPNEDSSSEQSRDDDDDSSVDDVDDSGYDGKTLTDSRDGHVYKTVKIGSQIWMAENLNYETENSFCYDNDTDNCEKYGRLYKWFAAVGESEKSCGGMKSCEFAEGSQGVCPSGWHVPTASEWDVLIHYAGNFYMAGKKLKSTDGWYDDGNGSDDYGFSVLPAGFKAHIYKGKATDEYFYDEGELALFWTSTEDSNAVIMTHALDHMALDSYVKELGFNVRCLKDSINDIESSDSPKINSSDSQNNPGKNGTFTDSRDGQSYKTVKIGSQVWMAENLNFKTEQSFCYENRQYNCDAYGRLYTISAALNACPVGWHLPAVQEWETLFESTDYKDLRSKKGWFYEDEDGVRHEEWNGTNLSGFNILPVGTVYLDTNGVFESSYGMGQVAYFWEVSLSLISDLNAINVGEGSSESYVYSVRCLKN